MEVKTREGVIKKFLVEVKPKEQTQPPKKPKNNNRKANARYMNEVVEFIKNKCKWESAQKFCNERGITFNIITEDDLFI